MKTKILTLLACLVCFSTTSAQDTWTIEFSKPVSSWEASPETHELNWEAGSDSLVAPPDSTLIIRLKKLVKGWLEMESLSTGSARKTKLGKVFKIYVVMNPTSIKPYFYVSEKVMVLYKALERVEQYHMTFTTSGDGYTFDGVYDDTYVKGFTSDGAVLEIHKKLKRY